MNQTDMSDIIRQAMKDGKAQGLSLGEASTLAARRIMARSDNGKQDLIWDALAAACDLETGQMTTTEQGKMRKAVKELRDVGATPEEVKRRAHRYRHEHPTWDLTPTALVAHWSSFAPRKQRETHEVPSYMLEPEPGMVPLPDRDAGVPPPPEFKEALEALRKSATERTL